MIYIASDHQGFQLKKSVMTFVKKTLKLDAEDLGPAAYDKEDDYTDYAIHAAKKVKTKADRAILICGTGHGMCIAANKIKNIKAALGMSIESTEFARKHDNINVLCLGAKFLSNEHAAAIVKTFLLTEFDGQENHLRRLKKIEALEK